MSIGLRRPPQITHDNFDFKKSELLHWEDLYEEGEAPRYFDAGAADTLRQMLARLVKFCVALTDFQVFSQVFQAPMPIETPQCLKYLDEVRRIKESLRSWFEETETMSLHVPSNADRQHVGASDFAADAVSLHLHLMYMYYQ